MATPAINRSMISCRSPETRRQADSHNKVGGIAEEAFDAVDGTIDSIIITAVFSYYKPNSNREIAEEQRHTDYNFIFSRGRNLRPLNNGFVSARRVSLHAGTDGLNGEARLVTLPTPP
jgi:hypothetical protein